MIRAFIVLAMLAGSAAAEQPMSVVKIIIHYANHQDRGSGTLISPRLILTAHHNVRAAGTRNRITIHFRSGFSRNAKVIKFDKYQDLALLQISRVFFLPIRVETRPVKIGQTVTIGGFPMGHKYHEVTGQVLWKRAPTRTGPDTLFEVSEPSIAGMSGSGVRDHTGALVGVLYGSDSRSGCTGLEGILPFLKGFDLYRKQ